MIATDGPPGKGRSAVARRSKFDSGDHHAQGALAEQNRHAGLPPDADADGSAGGSKPGRQDRGREEDAEPDCRTARRLAVCGRSPGTREAAELMLMTGDDFRRIALGIMGAVEGAHKSHPISAPTAESRHAAVRRHDGMVGLKLEHGAHSRLPQDLLAGSRCVGTRRRHPHRARGGR